MRQRRKAIQKITEGMSRRQKTEYILQYYWHYFLMAALAGGLVCLLTFHLTAGKPGEIFRCALADQGADRLRDECMAEAFASFLENTSELLIFDSDYQINYDDPETVINESDYEKFFLNWKYGEIDGAVMTESFLEYCMEMGGEIRGKTEIKDKEYMEKYGLHVPEGERLWAVSIQGCRHPEEADCFIEWIKKEAAGG